MSSGGPYRIGQQFGSYTLESYLGSGSFKSVYRARHLGGGLGDATVALGFPHQQDSAGLTELRKEFAVASQLHHPGILRVLGLQESEGIAFQVMQFAEGRTLREVIKERGSLPQAESLRYAGLVCEALAYAHSAHVFHRDVKPENIFITVDNVPLLLDFGIARVLARTAQRASTRVGTPTYMAPELFQGAAGMNADLWALGITLYELLTGNPPFVGEIGEVIHKIMHERHDEAALHEKGVDGRLIYVMRKLLHKDPDLRYQTAEELARDLETVARRTRLVDDDESRLEVLIRASFPLICALSHEEGRVLAAVRDVAQRLAEERGVSRPVYTWTVSRGLRDEHGDLVLRSSADDPTAALLHAIENPGDAIYVFLDMHHHYSPVTTRLVRDAAHAVRMTRKSLIFLSPFFRVPEELQKEVTLAVFAPPGPQQLSALVTRVVEETTPIGAPAGLPEEMKAAVVRATLGLTMGEAERALRMAALHDGGLVSGGERRVAEQKQHIIRNSGILEYCHSSESFSDVGGMDKLIHWFRARRPVYTNTERYAGLPMPKGVLLVGMPGCGKSLAARALAGDWGVPLVRLDVGRVFGSLVGESEANLRQAIQTAEAVSPCVLWIDEIEKGFAGVRNDVSARIFGSFLTWLQEKRSAAFVVATANELTGLPPELLRQGRFDEIFFVGLPVQNERQDLFAIHIAKRGRAPESFDLPLLARATEGFSGAEIEQTVVTALFCAFERGQEVTMEGLCEAVADAHPLSLSQAHRLAAVMAWGRLHARPAGGALSAKPDPGAIGALPS